jgi:uncharacterized membrane protein YhaH (DUF805 family)
MGFPVDGAGRVSQGKYWALFGAYMISVPVLMFAGVFAILGGSFLTGMVLMVAIIPLGAYWRVIMMRRCRDIGWPAFVPWLIFGLQIVTSFTLTSGAGAGATPDLSMFLVPLVLGAVDFVFMIVIGCIGTRRAVDYEDVFSGGSGRVEQTRPATAGSDGPDRYDDAIARALEAHRRGESTLSPPPAARPAPVTPTRAAVGFGRRVV